MCPICITKIWLSQELSKKNEKELKALCSEDMPLSEKHIKQICEKSDQPFAESPHKFQQSRGRPTHCLLIEIHGMKSTKNVS